MLKVFSDVVERAESLRNGRSTVVFARELQMTQQTVDLYLKGNRKPSLEFVYKLCKVYNISADWLLGLSTTKVEDSSNSLNSNIRALRSDADRAAESINKLIGSIAKFQEAVK